MSELMTLKRRVAKLEAQIAALTPAETPGQVTIEASREPEPEGPDETKPEAGPSEHKAG